MDKFILNVYGDTDDEVVKTVTCVPAMVRYGVFRKFLALSEGVSDEMELVRTIRSFEPLLTRLFPGLTEDDLDNTDPSELFAFLGQFIAWSVARIGDGSKNS
jgi:hypothetical protein